MRALRRPLAVLVLWVTAAGSGRAAELSHVWVDEFSEAERAMLVRWTEEAAAGVEALVGSFPMDVEVHYHRRDGAREPVPWANTRRGRVQGVHFHVDPGFPPSAFRRDWTAPHEFAHLVLPYVGRQHAWFAEGFASFMQYRVMTAMGVLSEEAAAARLRGRLARAARDYDYPDRPFTDAAARLRAQGRYPVMYWGGAAYFLQVDEALRSRGSDLIAVLRAYTACCRRSRARLEDLIAELDGLSGGSVFSAALTRFRSEPGFPAVPAAGEAAGRD
tara:strand:+ start:2644 stop:3465 length:822 start_codon:yes stop_codon:yes gene_type:complete